MKRYLSKQKKESKKLYPLSKEECLSSNLDVIKMYLNDEVDLNRYYLRRNFANEYFDAVRKNTEVDQLKQQVDVLTKEVNRLGDLNESLSRTLVNRVADRYRHFKEKHKK